MDGFFTNRRWLRYITNNRLEKSRGNTWMERYIGMKWIPEKLLDSIELPSTALRNIKTKMGICRQNNSSMIQGCRNIERAPRRNLAVNRKLAKVCERYYRIHLRDDWGIGACCKCITCGSSKGPQRRSRVRMKQYNVRPPFETIAMKIAGPFPESEKGNK